MDRDALTKRWCGLLTKQDDGMQRGRHRQGGLSTHTHLQLLKLPDHVLVLLPITNTPSAYSCGRDPPQGLQL